MYPRPVVLEIDAIAGIERIIPGLETRLEVQRQFWDRPNQKQGAEYFGWWYRWATHRRLDR